MHNAFCDCLTLNYADLPDGLEYIGKSCFEKTALELVKFPSALKIIDANAFYKCGNIKSVQFSEGLEKIGLYAFYKTGLTHIELPSSLRTVA